MSLDRPPRSYTRTDLFLVRIWSTGPEAGGAGAGAGAAGSEDGEGDGPGKVEWRGQVQRAGEGEAYLFRTWQDLLDLLVAMISNNKGR